MNLLQLYKHLIDLKRLRRLHLFGKLAALTLLLVLQLAFCLTLKGQDSSADFAIRAIHLDMRIQVMKEPALKKLALQIKQKGLNTIIMEWEGSFPFKKDPLISNKYAYTRAEVKDFVGYCNSIGIDVIPLQQSFGHVEYILRHPKYAALREDSEDLSQVCPSKVELNKQLFTRLFKEMAALDPSPYFHIGCDETHLLGHCPLCKARAAKIGLSRLYFDHIKMLCDIVERLGKRPVLWADIALKYPEYIHLLPKNTVFVDWNYGWDPNRFGAHKALLKSGYEIWGAAAMRSAPDNFYSTDWIKHFNNLRDFIPFCRTHHYKGMVLTSWSTSGVYWPVYGAENELIDLTPLRRVYPITGFDILLSAFGKAVNQVTPLNIPEFVKNYANKEFGLDKNHSKLFYYALFTSQPVFNEQQPQPKEQVQQTLKMAVDSAQFVSNTLKQLTPAKNKTQFAHLRLMADIRAFYLQLLQLKKQVNTDEILPLHFPIYLSKTRALMQQSLELNKRFTALNSSVLYPAAIKEENDLRNQAFKLFYAWINHVSKLAK